MLRRFYDSGREKWLETRDKQRKKSARRKNESCTESRFSFMTVYPTARSSCMLRDGFENRAPFRRCWPPPVFSYVHGPLSFTGYAYMRLSTLVYALKRRVSCGSNLRARYTRTRAGYASFIIYRTLEYGESTTVSTRFCAPRRQSAGTSIVVHCINSIILICFAFIMLYIYLACCERNFYQNHYYDLAMTFLSIFLLFSKCKAHQCCLFIRDVFPLLFYRYLYILTNLYVLPLISSFYEFLLVFVSRKEDFHRSYRYDFILRIFITAQFLQMILVYILFS